MYCFKSTAIATVADADAAVAALCHVMSVVAMAAAAAAANSEQLTGFLVILKTRLKTGRATVETVEAAAGSEWSPTVLQPRSHVGGGFNGFRQRIIGVK